MFSIYQTKLGHKLNVYPQKKSLIQHMLSKTSYEDIKKMNDTYVCSFTEKKVKMLMNEIFHDNSYNDVFVDRYLGKSLKYVLHFTLSATV